jgi:FKBP-type peptidyl-prolyl cis-trans isomerase
MIKRIIPIAILGAAIISNTGCNSDGGFKKTHGIEYKIVKDVKGKNASIGDIVEFNLIAKADTTELGNTYKQGHPGAMKVEEIKNSGDLQAVFPHLSAGDSAIVLISCDTIIKGIPADQLERAQKMQPWLKKGNKITINLTVVSVKSLDDYKASKEAEKKEKDAKQNAIDEPKLQEYFAKNGIKAEKTASGLYYTLKKPGTGDQIKAGESVSMKYTGHLLDGKAFDSNVDTSVGHHGTDPLTFSVGAHQMIAGVDEGVALLKKGSEATFYLPSALGYGEQAPPNIGPNQILVFDVSITDVKPASENKQMQGQPQAQPQAQ